MGERQRLLSLQSELEDSKAAALTTSTELASAKQMITALTESESNLKLKLQELEKSVGEHKVAVLSAQAETESRTTTEQELRSDLQTKVQLLSMLLQIRQWLLDQRHIVVEER